MRVLGWRREDLKGTEEGLNGTDKGAEGVWKMREKLGGWRGVIIV